MLQFFGVNGTSVIYINPHQVVAVKGRLDDNDQCEIWTTDSGEPWTVKGSAAEAQVRVWQELVR